MSVKVFVNTRFNIVTKGAVEHVDISGSPTRTPEWLERRFELFERFCLPSMMAQTDAHFRWLVFFSDRTPELFRERIAELQTRFPAFIPCFLEEPVQQERHYKAEVRKYLEPHDSHVITGRIDNDDAFHREMIARVRAEFHGQDDEFLNFLNGVQYDLDRGVLVALRKPSNAFLFRIERIKEGKVFTVLDVMHHQAQDTGLLRDIDTQPLWLQLIHGNNVLNRLASGRVRFNMDLQREFGIIGPVHIDRARSVGIAISQGLYHGPMKFARAVVRRILGR